MKWVKQLFGEKASQVTIDPSAPYVPPFNAFVSPLKDEILIPVEHMHQVDIDSLKTALKAKNISFLTEVNGEVLRRRSLGPVIEFDLRHLDANNTDIVISAVNALQRESHHQDNKSKAPSGAKIYPKSAGEIPAFNVIQQDGKKPILILVNDLFLNGKTNLLQLTLTELGIKSEYSETPDNGHVLQINKVDAKPLEELRKGLRKASNKRLFGEFGYMDPFERIIAKGEREMAAFNASSSGANATPSAARQQPINPLHTGYPKFLMAAIFPNLYTAVIPLSTLDNKERDAILAVLKKQNLNFEINPQKNEITIRDGNNPNQKSSPVQTIRDLQSRLPTATTHTSTSKAEADEPYIPPFNVKHTNKGAYILIEHMHYEDVNHLSKALTSRGIPFTEKDSDSSGLVYIVNDVGDRLEKLGSLMREARSQENTDRDPENVRIYRPLKGCPAINLLYDNGQPCIPFEGLMYQQVTALEERLNQSGIPFSRIENANFGFVFAIPETHAEKAEALSALLRREYNERKEVSKRVGACPQQHPTNKEPV